ARLSDVEKGLIPWGPESIDWRKWFLEVHAPALERHVFPEMEARLKRGKPAPRSHESLTTLLEGMAERHDLRVALQRTEREGLSRITYRELRSLSLATAKRLADAGVKPGDRVLLSGKNHPAWPVALFGILSAGATVVPFDPHLERDAFEVIAKASRARVLVADDFVAERVTSGRAQDGAAQLTQLS